MPPYRIFSANSREPRCCLAPEGVGSDLRGLRGIIRVAASGRHCLAPTVPRLVSGRIDSKRLMAVLPPAGLRNLPLLDPTSSRKLSNLYRFERYRGTINKETTSRVVSLFMAHSGRRLGGTVSHLLYLGSCLGGLTQNGLWPFCPLRGCATCRCWVQLPHGSCRT